MALVKTNEFIVTSQISPGYVNTVEGGNEFSKKYLKNNQTLIINEVMNNNYSYLDMVIMVKTFYLFGREFLHELFKIFNMY